MTLSPFLQGTQVCPGQQIVLGLDIFSFFVRASIIIIDSLQHLSSKAFALDLILYTEINLQAIIRSER
jgi:hypothetical protein